MRFTYVIGASVGVFLTNLIAGKNANALSFRSWNSDHQSGTAQKNEVKLRGKNLTSSPSADFQKKNTSLDLTLYQFHTCPFCSKVRSYLDYHSIPYHLVEVEPVFREQIKWSGRKKVPVVKITLPETQVLSESSLITSILHSYMSNHGQTSFSTLLKYYPEYESTDSNGKAKVDYYNKYFIVTPEGVPNAVDQRDNVIRKSEAEWRQWVEEVLVHTISPNVYRSLPEALESFNYITQRGNFGSFEAIVAKYIGGMSMWLISKRLKKRYCLDTDVRQSLYGAVKDWTEALGEQDFHGGTQPDLADLDVFGVLSCFEDMQAFADMLMFTDIEPWFYRMKSLCQANSRRLENIQAE